MKRMLLSISLLAIVILNLCVMVNPVLAGGDQNCERHRSDIAAGDPPQNQVNWDGYGKD